MVKPPHKPVPTARRKGSNTLAGATLISLHVLTARAPEAKLEVEVLLARPVCVRNLRVKKAYWALSLDPTV